MKMINEQDDEFYVTLMSNANTSQYKNTLSHFKNDLPVQLYLKQEDNWMVCIKSLGFSTSFFNIENELKEKNFPSIIIVKNVSPFNFSADEDRHYGHSSREKMYEKVFILPEKRSLNRAAIFLNDAIMSIGRIRKAFEHARNIVKEVEINVSSGAKPTITSIWPKEGDQASHKCSFVIIMHEHARKTFDFAKNDFRETVKVYGEEYHVYEMSTKYHKLVGLSRNWYYKYPKLVQIECSEIKERINNSTFQKYLSVICPNFTPEDKYFTHSFDVEEYCQVSNSFLSNLSISLKDEQSQLLNLQPGPATFVKLKFKKMWGNNFFNVRLSSESGNFESSLPQPIYLDAKWKACITSVSYPTILYGLPTDIKLRTVSGDFFFSNDCREIICANSVIIPTSAGSLSEMAAIIDMFLKRKRLGDLDIVSEGSNIAVFLKISKAAALSFPKWVLEMLGFIKADFDSKVVGAGGTCTYNSGDFVNMHNITPADLVIKATYQMSSLSIRPEYMMIYCDAIKPCIVGSDFMKLMCVVPIRSELTGSSASYTTEEFARPETHGLETTYLKSLKITLKTHWGTDISFPEGRKMFINILFSRDI